MAGPLRVEHDVETARWVQASLADFGSVAANVPPIFDAYARILHPATLSAPTGETDAFGGVEQATREISWAQAAELRGEERAKSEAWSVWLSRFGEDWIEVPPGRRLEGQALPRGTSIGPPHLGDIPVGLLAALAELLLDEHGDAEVLAAVWEGRELDVTNPGTVMFWTDDPELAEQHPRDHRAAQAEHEAAVRASIDPEITVAMQRQHVLGLPGEQQGRGHVLLRGPLGAFADPAWEREAGLGWRPEWPFQGRTPNAIWPVRPHATPAWFIATDLDLDVTLLGGSAHLIGRLLAHPAIEAERIRPTDPLL